MENEREMPIGLAFQMAMNQSAMENFGRMTETEKRQVLEVARSVHTKDEMRNIVDDLGKMS